MLDSLRNYGPLAVVLCATPAVCFDVVCKLKFNKVSSLLADKFSDVKDYTGAGFSPDYIIIFMDDFGGAASIFDDLRLLRIQNPNASFILISADFSEDEFGTHRCLVTDISIRYPFTHAVVKSALKQAPLNRAIWEQRSALFSNPHSSADQGQSLGTSVYRGFEARNA